MEKVVLITGASTGIGQGIGQILSENGYLVYGTSRTDKPNQSEKFKMVALDVNDPASVDIAIQKVVSEAGKIDVLINNAGLGIAGPIEETPIEDVKKVFDTNFHGLLAVIQAVLPVMRKQKSGHIINVSSIGGEVGLPFRGIYCASKFAVEGMTEALSMEVKQFGIKVSIVQPGDYRTSINQNRIMAQLKSDSAYRSTYQPIADQINKEVLTARDPREAGKDVLKVLQKSNPGVRFRSAPFMQQLTPKIKKFLGARTFEKLVMGHYGLK